MGRSAYEEDEREAVPWVEILIYGFAFLVMAFIVVSCIAGYNRGVKTEQRQKEAKITEVVDERINE